MRPFERARLQVLRHRRKLLLALGLVVLAPAAPLIIAILIVLPGNAWAQYRFEDAVSKVPIPDDSSVVDHSTEFGHLRGNGDHCDVRVLQVLATPLSAQELQQLDDAWAASIRRSLERRTLVFVHDLGQPSGDRHLLEVEWFTYGVEGGLDTIDPRC